MRKQTFKLTAEWLEERKACKSELDEFKKAFPKGLRVTKDQLKKAEAVFKQSSFTWLLSRKELPEHVCQFAALNGPVEWARSVVANRKISPSLVRKIFAKHISNKWFNLPEVRGLAGSLITCDATPADVVGKMAKCPDERIREDALQHRNCPYAPIKAAIKELDYSDPNSFHKFVTSVAASRKETSPALLEKMLNSGYEPVAIKAAKNPSTPVSALLSVPAHKYFILDAVLANPALSDKDVISVLEKYQSGSFVASQREKISRVLFNFLLKDGHRGVLYELAGRKDLSAAQYRKLLSLIGPDSPFLLAALALNPAVSVSALQRIAGKLLSLPEDDLNSSFAHCYTVRCLCVNPSVPVRVFKKLVDKLKLHPDTQKMLMRLRRHREKVALKASASAVCAYGNLVEFFC